MTLTRSDAAFATRALALKDVAREGWKRVPRLSRVESVADHAWGLAFLALLAAERDPSLDRGKLLSLALVHDLAEVVTGDLTPDQVSTQVEKHERERAGLEELLRDAEPLVAQRLRTLWEEYEAGSSPEARLVRDLDKLEMALQARRYEAAGADGAALAEFVESARVRMVDVGLRGLVD